MRRHAYQPAELHFAYCYHTYLRWSTYRRRPHPPLANLDRSLLQQLADSYDLHVLECAARETDVRVLISLKPTETVSACASKLKGRTSRWLREALGLDRPSLLLSKGYFAATSGKSTREQVEGYLNQQGDHHGYTPRPLPPVYVESFAPSADLERLLQPSHAFTRLQFHLVLATCGRRGVFGAEEGRAVARGWQTLQAGQRFVLRKVSFVPDHVHVAVQVHPAVVPAALIVALMNCGEEVVFGQFPQEVVGNGLKRLWQPSAYVGSYGDLASPQVHEYLRRWQSATAAE
jgi:REP element-mobilizing transposase RayT